MKSAGKQAGATLLWTLGAVVMAGLITAAIAQLVPSTMQSKITQEAGMRAYYNANSGLNYILGMEAASELNGVSFANYINSMGNGSSVTMSLDSNDVFSYQVGNTNHSSNTYQITNLIGSVKNLSKSTAYSYMMYGASKGNSAVRTYTPAQDKKWSDNNGNYIINVGNSTLEISQPTAVNSDTGANNIQIDYGATINGNAISKIGVTLAQASTVSKDVCAANGDVTLNYGAIVTGSVSAKGDIDMYQSASIGKDANSTNYISMYYYTKIGGTATSPNPITYIGDGQSVGHYVKATPTINCASVNAPYDNTITSCGTKDKNATKSGLTLSPASYGKITTDQDGILYLSSGTYTLCSFSTGYNAKVYLDVSSGEDLNILVKGDVNFSQATTFYIKTPSSNTYVEITSATPHSAAKYVYLGSSSNVTFGYSLSWFGTIYAKTSITLGQGFSLIGAIGTPGTLSVGYGINIIEYVLADYAENNWSTTAK